MLAVLLCDSESSHVLSWFWLFFITILVLEECSISFQRALYNHKQYLRPVGVLTLLCVSLSLCISHYLLHTLHEIFLVEIFIYKTIWKCEKNHTFSIRTGWILTNIKLVYCSLHFTDYVQWGWVVLGANFKKKKRSRCNILRQLWSTHYFSSKANPFQKEHIFLPSPSWCLGFVPANSPSSVSSAGLLRSAWSPSESNEVTDAKQTHRLDTY